MAPKDTTVWLSCSFQHPEKISSFKVYWFDDGPDGGCRIPESWRLYYRQDGHWVPMPVLKDYPVTKDAYDEVEFLPVIISELKLEIDLLRDFSTGIHEIIIY